MIIGEKYFESEKAYQDFLVEMRVLQADLDRYYDEVGPGVYVRRVPDEGTPIYTPIAETPAGDPPGVIVPTGEATTRRLSATCTDGLSISAGDPQRFSTGPVRPKTVNGWANPMGAVGLDASYASHALSSGTYTGELVATDFGFDIPVDASITGVEVKVTRRKL